MSERSVFDKLRARGEEVFGQVSNELLANPRFMQAMAAALRGKERIDEAVTQAMRTMNVPTRTEFVKVERRVQVLETQLSDLRAAGNRRTAAVRGAAGRPVKMPKRARHEAAATSPSEVAANQANAASQSAGRSSSTRKTTPARATAGKAANNRGSGKAVKSGGAGKARPSRARTPRSAKKPAPAGG